MAFEKEYLDVGERGESGLSLFYFAGRRLTLHFMSTLPSCLAYIFTHLVFV